LRNEASRSLDSELLVPGYHIHEALSISEAIWLCIQRHLGIIVVAANLEDLETMQLHALYTIFRLKPDITAHELVRELALMLPEESAAAAS
jgi:hypothetical protein